MAIKGGQILHVAGAGFIVDRIQSGGVTGININEERLEELGNYEAIGTVRDIPDLTFEIESYDVTTEFESILLGGTNIEANGFNFNFANSVPIDILSPYKSSGLFTVAGSVVVPTLQLESMSYSMSLSDPMTMTATLRGDSVFYAPGSPYREAFNGTGAQVLFPFANTALASVIGGDTFYALAAYVDGVKQRIGSDFTNTATGVTFLTAPPAGTGNVVLVYASATGATYNQAVHNTTSPAGIRGRDIKIQLGNGAAVYTDWFGIQSANVDWSASLERDEEFGNPLVVDQDFDVPEVSGSVTMKPSDVPVLFAQIQKIAGVSGTAIANATQDPPELEFRAVISDGLGTVMKTLQVSDAKWSMPSLQGSTGAKLETDFAFTSSTGVLNVFKGAQP